jgi:hypothetical protein
MLNFSMIIILPSIFINKYHYSICMIFCLFTLTLQGFVPMSPLIPYKVKSIQLGFIECAAFEECIPHVGHVTFIMIYLILVYRQYFPNLMLNSNLQYSYYCMWKAYHNEFKANMKSNHPSTFYFFRRRPMVIPVHFVEAFYFTFITCRMLNKEQTLYSLPPDVLTFPNIASRQLEFMCSNISTHKIIFVCYIFP